MPKYTFEQHEVVITININAPDEAAARERCKDILFGLDVTLNRTYVDGSNVWFDLVDESKLVEIDNQPL